MPSDLYIHPGNPINIEKTKKFYSGLSWPVRVEALEKHAAATTRRYLFTALVFPVVHLCAMYLYVGSAELAELRMAMLAFLFVFLVVGKRQDIPVLHLLLPPILFAGFMPTVTLPTSMVPGLWLLATLALLHFNVLFERHYRSVTVETGWSLIKRAIATSVSRTAAFIDAIHSYMTYAQGGVYAPGMKASAVGPASFRVAHAAFVYLVVFYACIVTAVKTVPIENPSAEFSVVIFILAWIVAAHFLPLLLIGAVTFVLTAPFLSRYYAAKQADLSPERFAECFPELIATLIEECGVNE